MWEAKREKINPDEPSGQYWTTPHLHDVDFQETHIMHEYPSDFYGSLLRVCVVGWIRPEKSFDSLGKLCYVLLCILYVFISYIFLWLIITGLGGQMDRTGEKL